MKHIPQSLLERAAEMYDFGAALRAPAPAAARQAPTPPAPEPEPAAALEPAAIFEPAPVPTPASILRAPVRPVLRAVETPAPAPSFVPTGETLPIDHARLVAEGYIVPGAPVSGIEEEFRLVKRELLASLEAGSRSVLIASAQPKAGKTFAAINLALSLAGEQDIEVLLVDGDFLKPDALSTLGLPNDGPGLIDALADPAVDPNDYVLRTDFRNLSVLPAGRKTNNVPELLASDRTREVLAKLDAGDRTRIILFDSPPVLMASHATVLAGHVGQVLVVVRADQTTEADLRETIGLLHGCRHIRLILNAAGLGVTGRKFGAYDGYGHDK